MSRQHPLCVIKNRVAPFSPPRIFESGFESFSSRRSFSDGAGGKASAPPHLRRVGAGATTFSMPVVDIALQPPRIGALALRFSSVPGAQMVPRAETLGAWLAFPTPDSLSGDTSVSAVELGSSLQSASQASASPAPASPPAYELGYDATYVGQGLGGSSASRSRMLRGRNVDMTACFA